MAALCNKAKPMLDKRNGFKRKGAGGNEIIIIIIIHTE